VDGNAVAHLVGPAEDVALEPSRLVDAYLDVGEHRLPDTGWAEHHVGRDLPQVGTLGRGVLRKRQCQAVAQAEPDGEHLLTDPRQRQE
jgi:hypothetical protein